MKEIGGYFELEINIKKEYHSKLIRLNSARNCLKYILLAQQPATVYIPNYICSSIIEPLEKLKINYTFYNISEEFEIIQNIQPKKNEKIFYVNYFSLKSDYIKKLVNKYGEKLIIDNTQSFFEKPLPGIDTIYSPRKFFGVSDGGYLNTTKLLSQDFEKDESYSKIHHLLGRLDKKASDFYAHYQKSEQDLINKPIKSMSSLTQKILSSINYISAKNKRKENFKYVHSKLKNTNLLDIDMKKESVPFVYPFMTNKENIRTDLMKNNIYVARYWSEVLERINITKTESNFVNQIIPLPIDQRYNIDHMKKIINIIRLNDEKKINVLIFPCGTENALEIYSALRYSVHVNIIGASSIDDMGVLIYENYIGSLPNIKDSEFNETFNKTLEKNEINLVFATHDTVIQHLSKIKMNAFLVNGDSRTTSIARSKRKTYELFSKASWCPTFYDDLKNTVNFPVICKPDLGQGAQSVYKCNNINELEINIKKVENPVIVEYLPGEEITVDCFTDRNKKLIWVQPRSREKVKAGISMRSSYINLDEQLEKITFDINYSLTMRGPWFFQAKKNKNGDWKLLEVSCRTAGTMVAQRAKGINLPLMAVQDYMERDLNTIPYDFVDYVERSIKTKCKINITFSKVYIDFDDTIIINGHVEPIVIAFIYEMKRKNKELILITRHDGNLDAALKAHSLSKCIFSEIIHIKDGSLKSKHIQSKDSIFVDNHFLERSDVYQKTGIPVFDVDYLEFF